MSESVKKKPLLEFIKDNAILITIVTFSFYSYGFCYLYYYTDFFGISIFDLDLRNVDLIFCLTRSNSKILINISYLVVITIIFLINFERFYKISSKTIYNSNFNKKSGLIGHSKVAMQINTIIKFAPIALMVTVIFSITSWVPSTAREDALRITQGEQTDIIQYKSLDLNGKETIVKISGRYIIGSSAGVWFYDHSQDNILLKEPLTIFIPNRQIIMITNPISSILKK